VHKHLHMRQCASACGVQRVRIKAIGKVREERRGGI